MQVEHKIKLTHAELVNIGYRFVLNNFSCGIAYKEIKTISAECADVIGFGSYTHSVLIEVKVSRSDFLADRKKPFRINPERGIGMYRFYMCPEGLIKTNDLPKGWGLIWVNALKKPKIIFNPFCMNNEATGLRENGFERNIQAERDILYSALRRTFKRN
ncbi:hypothetical protein [Pedobacter zeae]|uniref:Uncharacterized protein n=1 Tax=Pedobacter zeae TaxID=1737356 RepID=A0A7W6K9T8_9SPHI|nr:hypothetical protein [Pedobacter zeae]MBB4107725.1 hypothetical protein [Pedobacter zeae]GGG97473.1 hypothetical protein GCM10007422_09290 [Pedobacter zeae]